MSKGNDGVSLDYALVSMIGGLDEHHQLLLINGWNTAGTQAAMEYLCNPQTARNLIRHLRAAAPRYQGNWQFQLILRTEVWDQVPNRGSSVIGEGSLSALWPNAR